MWEHAEVMMFGLHRTLGEWNAMTEEDQNWAIATWRTKNKLRSIESVVAHERRK